MANTITVKAGDSLRPGEVAIWEVNAEHPDGEVLIAAPHPGEQVPVFTVARTPAVNARLNDGRLVETREQPTPRPSVEPAAQAPSASPPATTSQPPAGGTQQQADPLAFLTPEQRASLAAAGYGSVEAIRAASDQQLDDVPGIGPETVKKLRDATKE